MQKFLHVSERMHIGLIVLAELATPSEARSLREIAQKMHVSEGYLEEVAGLLRKAGYIQGKRGAGGGYALASDPAKLTLYEILVALDGPIAVVPCQSPDHACAVSPICKTRDVWSVVQARLLDVLRSTTLASLLSSSSSSVTYA
jgi:Rrf2 family cysteine metabolism transcriptional repressor